ncbi:MAG: adenylyltransferase/cytidyltransferase family protein [Patescibacteria group bacterium]
MAIEQLVRGRIESRAHLPPPADKLLSQDQAREFVKSAHALGKTVVLLEGTWDLTHAGHVQHIREAKKHADLVLLRLASAEYAVNYKGPYRPLEMFRDMVVSEFEDVDAVFVDQTVVSPDDIAENAHILYQLGVDKIALEVEDDKFLQKMKSTDYANRHLGAKIQPVVLVLPYVNSTTAIINKIKSMV